MPDRTLHEVPPVVSEVPQSAGQPLDPETRAFMEPRFGHDFGQVRVHTDTKAAEAARAVSAEAYTVGNDIVFGEEGYAPATHAGRELLAHELAHTVQQTGRRDSALSSPASDEVLERNAEATGRDVADRRTPSVALSTRGVMLARAPVSIDAYTDEMLEKALTEVRQRLEQESYSGRDRDVDWHMALKWEADKRALAAAKADAEATVARMDETQKQTEAEEKAEEAQRSRPIDYRSKSLLPTAEELGAPPQFDYDKIERAFKEQKEAEQQAEAAALKRQEEGRPARLAEARRRLILHGLRRGDEAEEMARFLTTSDMLVLRKHGLEPPGILSNFGGRYAENAIEVIDKLVPRNPVEDRANMEDLRSRAGAINQTAKKIEGMKNEGAHAFLGRLEGTVVAHIFGKDPIQGGEIGAAIGGAAGAKSEIRARASIDRQSREPSNEPAFAKSANVATSGTVAPSAPAKGHQGTYPPTAGLTFRRPVDLTGGAQFPTQPAQSRVSMRLPEPATSRAKPSGRSPLRSQINRASDGDAGGKTPKQSTRPKKASDKSEEPDTHTLLSNREDPKAGKKAPKPAPVAKSEKPSEPPASESQKKPDKPAASSEKTPGQGAPAGQKTDAPSERLISHETLNRPIPQNQGITGPKRMLTPAERKTANQIIDVLERVNRRDAKAMEELGKYRPHKHEGGEWDGWWSVDLMATNAGALNIMRIYFRATKAGPLEAVVRQGH